jgi:hypothetical protein
LFWILHLQHEHLRGSTTCCSTDHILSVLHTLSYQISILLVLSHCAGSSVESERGPAADLVLNVVYIVGLLTFAAVLGIVCDDVASQVDKVGCGRAANMACSTQ